MVVHFIFIRPQSVNKSPGNDFSVFYCLTKGGHKFSLVEWVISMILHPYKEPLPPTALLIEQIHFIMVCLN